MPEKARYWGLSPAVYVTIIWIMLMILIPRPCLAQSPRQKEADVAPGAWEIQADSLRYDQIRDEYFAEGNVTITRGQSILTADQVRLNQKTREAIAVGSIRLVSGQDILTGDRLFLNLGTETGILEDGRLFASETHFYISGDQIEKTGSDSYRVQGAKLTSCDGENPDWYLTASDLKVTVEGYGLARNVAFFAGRIPLLYTPFIAFPAKRERQSGLLAPRIGNSDRRGFEYAQPLYWAIGQSSDATFFSHYMSRRGTRAGLEYRYILDEKSLGVIMAEGFNDRKIDDGLTDNSENWGYTDDNFLRSNEDRYWLRAKINQDLPWDATAKLDLDIVSDQDYLNEFKSALYGFEQTRAYYLETFGRDVDDVTDPVRLNRLNISRNWAYYALNADVRWQDDVIARRQLETNTTLQNLPLITFDGIKQPIGGSRYYYDLTSSLVNFYREDGDQGRRMDIYPRFYYLFTFFGGLSVEPSAGFRQTAWHVDPEDSSAGGSDTDYRAVYDVKLETETRFFRIYDFHLAGSDRMRHTLQPNIVYEYIPDQDQTDLPFFDDIDRIEQKNLITYSILNNFTARSPLMSEKSPAYAYFDFMRLNVQQSYDFNKAADDDPEPFSDITAELDINPAKYLFIDADAAWSPYNGEFTSYNMLMVLWDDRGDRLSVDYRYNRDPEDAALDEIETILASVQIVLDNRWSTNVSYEYNFFTNSEIASQIGLSYQSQCWAVDVFYRTEDDDQQFSALVTLLGLGTIGN